MSPSERREMIGKENTRLSLTGQCKPLRISRPWINFMPVGFDPTTLDLMHEIDRVFTKYRFFHCRAVNGWAGPLSGKHLS